MKVIDFFRDTIEEAKRLTLPNKKEVYFTTITILVVSMVVSFSITFVDVIISKIVKIILGLGA
jgi:preprotein translocase SecE subunit